MICGIAVDMEALLTFDAAVNCLLLCATKQAEIAVDISFVYIFNQHVRVLIGSQDVFDNSSLVLNTWEFPVAYIGRSEVFT